MYALVTPIDIIKDTKYSLKTFEKVLETVVKQQLEKYIEEN